MAQQVNYNPPQEAGGQPAPPTSYVEMYRQRADPLDGRYTPLFSRHLVTSGATPDTLLNQLLSSSEEVPKVFLCLTQETFVDRPARLRTVTLHRVGRYQGSQVLASPWDARTFAFASDLMPGNHVRMVELPAAPFGLVGVQTVPTLANVHAVLAANPAHDHMPPLAEGSADSEQLNTRRLVQVPPKYVEIVLGRSLSPRQLWAELGGAIINDTNEVACSHLLDWMRVAVTTRGNANQPENPFPPNNTLPAPSLSALVVDDALQAMRWHWLRTDLPALDPQAPMSQTEQFMATIGVFRQERLEEREADLERRTAADAPKRPTEVFQPDLVAQWQRLSSVHTEAEPRSLRGLGLCHQG